MRNNPLGFSRGDFGICLLQRGLLDRTSTAMVESVLGNQLRILRHVSVKFCLISKHSFVSLLICHASKVITNEFVSLFKNR